VPPSKANYVEDLCIVFSQGIWEYLHDSYGGGPACNHLFICPTCQQDQESLECRQKQELDTFIKLNKDFQAEESPGIIYAISMNWFRQWENFARSKESEPPGPIENSGIAHNKNGQIVLKVGSDYAQLSEPMWQFLRGIYGGGPELLLRQNGSVSSGVHSAASTPTSIAPCSVHTAGKTASVSTEEKSSLPETRETDKQAGGDMTAAVESPPEQLTQESGCKSDTGKTKEMWEMLKQY